MVENDTWVATVAVVRVGARLVSVMPVAAMVAAFFLIIDRRQDAAMLADKDMLPVRMLLGRENMTTTLFSDMVTHARVILNHIWRPAHFRIRRTRCI